MHGESIKILNWSQHDDINLEVPHVETNDWHHLQRGGGFFKHDAYL